MPITTKQMSTDVAKVPEFQYGDGTVNISYAPSRITEATLGKILSMNDGADQPPAPPQGIEQLTSKTDLINEVLASLIVDWDLYEDDAMTVKVPHDEEHLQTLPILFRAEMINRIVGAFAPNEIGATQNESAPSLSTTQTSVMEPPSDASSS